MARANWGKLWCFLGLLSIPALAVTIEENINAIKGLLDRPQDADGVNTFYFGYTGVQGDDPLLCQEKCQEEPRCRVFTYFYMNYPGPPDPPDHVWYGECLGRTNFQNVWEPEERVASGRIEAIDGCHESAGWYEHDGACYYISQNEAETEVTWHDAHAWCREQGGDLASIHSVNETLFIYELGANASYVGDLWIGLSQLEDKQTYRWSDGTESEYSAWVPDHPVEDGLHQCTYQPSVPFHECMTVESNTNSVRSTMVGCSGHDNHDTFCFYNTSDASECQDKCLEEPRCVSFAYFEEGYWDLYFMWFPGDCAGRSDFMEIQIHEMRVTSGFREDCPESWISANCGLRKGFVCKKDIESDDPRPVPPTDPVPGFCPAGYFGVDNKCYMMVEGTPNVEGQGWTWQEAREICRSVSGGDLASLHTPEQNAVITTRLQDLYFGYWIGYYEVGDEWVWSDNSQPEDFTNWADDRPGFTNGDCAEIWTEDLQTGRWNNRQCQEKRGYICQVFKDENNTIVTPPSTTPHSCADGWTPFWYACYLYEDTRLTWQEAQDRCHDKDSELVSFAGGAAENAAASLMVGSNAPYWIGLRESEEGQYQWSDGWPLVYTNWAAGEPGGGEGCVRVEADGKWADSWCTQQLASVCKTSEVPPPTTPANSDGVCFEHDWISFGEHCYYFYKTGDDYFQGWDQARAECIRRGGEAHPDSNLASIHSAAENEFIRVNVEAASGLSSWIGLRKQGSGAPFEWSDGSPVDFEAWAPGEPNDQDGTENCVELFPTMWPGRWNDIDCNNYYSRSYVCKALKLPAPTSPPEVPGTCPGDSWIHRAEFCFWFSPDSFMTWNQARYDCQQRGGDEATLASINDDLENAFVLHHSREQSGAPVAVNVWLGLVREDASEGDQWLWDDGSDLDYTNWAAGGGEDVTKRCGHLLLSDGKWDGESCQLQQGYVCKVRKDGIPPWFSTTPVSKVDIRELVQGGGTGVLAVDVLIFVLCLIISVTE